MTLENLNDWLIHTLWIMMTALSIKTILGFRWPWEVCRCCGKRQREH